MNVISTSLTVKKSVNSLHSDFTTQPYNCQCSRSVTLITAIDRMYDWWLHGYLSVVCVTCDNQVCVKKVDPSKSTKPLFQPREGHRAQGAETWLSTLAVLG